MSADVCLEESVTSYIQVVASSKTSTPALLASVHLLNGCFLQCANPARAAQLAQHALAGDCDRMLKALHAQLASGEPHGILVLNLLIYLATWPPALQHMCACGIHSLLLGQLRAGSASIVQPSSHCSAMQLSDLPAGTNTPKAAATAAAAAHDHVQHGHVHASSSSLQGAASHTKGEPAPLISSSEASMALQMESALVVLSLTLLQSIASADAGAATQIGIRQGAQHAMTRSLQAAAGAAGEQACARVAMTNGDMHSVVLVASRFLHASDASCQAAALSLLESVVYMRQGLTAALASPLLHAALQHVATCTQVLPAAAGQNSRSQAHTNDTGASSTCHSDGHRTSNVRERARLLLRTLQALAQVQGLAAPTSLHNAVAAIAASRRLAASMKS